MEQVSHYVIACVCGEKTRPGLCKCGRYHQVDFHQVTTSVRDSPHAEKIADWMQGGPAEPPRNVGSERRAGPAAGERPVPPAEGGAAA